MVYNRLNTPTYRQGLVSPASANMLLGVAAFFSLIWFDVWRCYHYYWFTYVLLWLPVLMPVSTSNWWPFMPFVLAMTWLDVVTQSHFGTMTAVYMCYLISLLEPLVPIDDQHRSILGLVVMFCSCYAFFVR